MDEENNKLQKQPGRNMISLGNGMEIDATGVPEHELQALKKKAIEQALDLSKKSAELGIDNQAMDTRLNDMAENVTKATNAGVAGTFSGAYNDQMGRTEVMMGNTEAAQKGKLSRSARGESDNTMIYVVIAAVVVVILALLLK